MKKTIYTFLILAFTILNGYSQTPATSTIETPELDCDEICEVERVIQEGTLLGVKITNYQHDKGAIVLKVLDHTAAKKYSFQKLDVILSVNDTAIKGMKHLVQTIQSYKPSNVVNIRYLRGDKIFNKDVILGAKKTRKVIQQVCCEDNSGILSSVNVNVFPNPAISSINITLEDAPEGKYSFQIFNLNGERVVSDVHSYNSGFTNTMDISTIPSGEYFIMISKDDNSFTTSFIKQD